jgi:RNA polymerase sigma-B factor
VRSASSIESSAPIVTVLPSPAPRPLDAPARADGHGDLTRSVDVPDPEHGGARSEDATALWQLSAVLDERAREVIRLRFGEDLFQRELGERVGVSQTHVSRILRDSIAQSDRHLRCR